MREILFRAKRKDNGEWETGSLVYARMGTSEEQASIADKMTAYHTPVIPETVGQYTGLRDKNSTRIFEADIVKVYDVYCNETVVGVVEFCDGSFRIYDKDFTSYDRWMYCKVEVIGNVYDDVNLLEGE